MQGGVSTVRRRMMGVKGGSGLIMCDLMEVEGRHNEVWEKGNELIRVIGVGVGEMMGLDQ